MRHAKSEFRFDHWLQEPIGGEPGRSFVTESGEEIAIERTLDVQLSLGRRVSARDFIPDDLASVVIQKPLHKRALTAISVLDCFGTGSIGQLGQPNAIGPRFEQKLIA